MTEEVKNENVSETTDTSDIKEETPAQEAAPQEAPAQEAPAEESDTTEAPAAEASSTEAPAPETAPSSATETKPAGSSDSRPQDNRPSGGSSRPYSDNRGSGDRPQRAPRFRRKVCRFCYEKDMVIDYKNAEVLERFITDRGKILPRRVTGTCSKHQRELARAIKRARIIALVPFLEK